MTELRKILEKYTNDLFTVPKINVLCILFAVVIAGLYFFQVGGITNIMISNRYYKILENFLQPKTEEYDTDAL